MEHPQGIDKRNIVIDLDGTLALDHHRRELITSHGWGEYFDACSDDTVNYAVLSLMKVLYSSFFTLHIFTGRSEIVLEQTEDWLDYHKVPHHNLVMRKKADCDHTSKDHTGFRCDTEVKLEMLAEHNLTPKNVLFMLDDRDDMTTFYREQGFDCFQVREQGKMVLPGKEITD